MTLYQQVNTTKRIALAAFVLISINSTAQDGLTDFLYAGKADANKLTNAYLQPVFEGLSYGFNGGWITSAKTHKNLALI